MTNYFRNTRARELESIAQILQKAEIVSDITPLQAAANNCRRQRTSHSKWGYRIDGLLFRISDNLKLTFPRNVSELTLTLSIMVEGECWGKTPSDNDPFTKYNFQLIIRGQAESETRDDYMEVKSSWHLDRHVDGTNANPPQFFHPHYHFQFGGRVLKDVSYDSIDLANPHGFLVVDSPRLPHPPLEGLLGIDFVLTNFIDRSKLAFREEGDYANLLRRMQKNIWQGYANAIASTWTTPSQAWSPSNLWPQLDLTLTP